MLFRSVGNSILTSSLVMRSKTGTVRTIEAEHDLVRKPSADPKG